MCQEVMKSYYNAKRSFLAHPLETQNVMCMCSVQNNNAGHIKKNKLTIDY